MKAFNISREKRFARAGLILLFDGEVAPLIGAGRAQPNRYPDFELEPRSRLPGRDGQWQLGVCRSLQWRNRPRFTRGSLTRDCETDFQRARRLYAATNRERNLKRYR